MEIQTTTDGAGVDGTPQSTPGVEPVVAQTPTPAVPTETASKGTPNGKEKVVELRTRDFKKIKEQAKQRGFKKAEQDTLARFAKYGCKSLDDVEKLLESRTKPEPPAVKEKKPMAKTAPEEKQPRKRPDAKDRKIAQLEAKHAAELKRWRSERNRRKELQVQNDALQAEMALREVAVRAGIKDVDYAMHLAAREMKGKDTEWLSNFNEGEFFGKILRDSHPYLFGEVEVPATTGTAGNGSSEAPAEPAPEEITTTEAAGEQFDAMSASREDYESRLRAIGINPP